MASIHQALRFATPPKLNLFGFGGASVCGLIHRFMQAFFPSISNSNGLTVHYQNAVFRDSALIFLSDMGRKPKKRRNAYGAWLLFLRQERGLTQEEAALLTGLPRTTLMYWERTGNMVGRKQILKLAKAYRVSVTELLRS